MRSRTHMYLGLMEVAGGGVVVGKWVLSGAEGILSAVVRACGVDTRKLHVIKSTAIDIGESEHHFIF